MISVAESDVAPHFLNGRKGVWLRTNEFSARFEAQLADENELNTYWTEGGSFANVGFGYWNVLEGDSEPILGRTH